MHTGSPMPVRATRRLQEAANHVQSPVDADSKTKTSVARTTEVSAGDCPAGTLLPRSLKTHEVVVVVGRASTAAIRTCTYGGDRGRSHQHAVRWRVLGCGCRVRSCVRAPFLLEMWSPAPTASARMAVLPVMCDMLLLWAVADAYGHVLKATEELLSATGQVQFDEC